jgi:hypothetical protein
MKRIYAGACTAALLIAFPLRADDAAKPEAITVPFELLKTKHIAVQVKINDKGPYRLIFDTGAPITLLNTKIGKEAGIIKKGQKKPFFSLFNAAGPTKIDKVEIGELKAEKVGAVVMDHPTVDAISRALGPIDGIVGMPFWGRYKMTIDYQKKEMTFTPNGYEPPDAMEAMMATVMALMARDKPPTKILTASGQWGMVVDKSEDDEEAGVTIKSVVSGGAAAKAGLQSGDRLLTLDGRWTDSVPDCYTAAAAAKAGMAVNVKIVRQGKERVLSITPSPGL